MSPKTYKTIIQFISNGAVTLAIIYMSIYPVITYKLQLYIYVAHLFGLISDFPPTHV